MEDWCLFRRSRGRSMIIQGMGAADKPQAERKESKPFKSIIEQYIRGNDLLSVAATSFSNVNRDDKSYNKAYLTSNNAAPAGGAHRSVKMGRVGRKNTGPYPEKKHVEDKFIKMKISMDSVTKAIKLMKNGDTLAALSVVDEAFAIWPENDTAYAIRGKIYLKMTCNRPSSLVKKAFIDFEAALKLNPRNSVAKTGFSQIMFESAKLYVKEQKYLKAERCLNATLKYDDAHAEATQLLSCLKYLRKFK